MDLGQIILMDIASLASTLPQLLGMLPLVLQATRVLFQLFFIWFFGTVSMRGFRGHRPFFLSITGTLLAGSLCLVGGSAFAGFIPFLSGGFFSILQMDMIAAGIAVSILIMISLSLMTHEKAGWRPEEMVELLKRKVSGLEELLSRKAHHIAETEAKKTASGVMKGYKAAVAKLVGSEYEVTMRKDGKEGKVIIDAWDGEVKKGIRHESRILLFLHDPRKVLGLVMLIGLTAASLIFFEGFPNPTGELASMLGMTADDFEDLSSRMADSPLLGQDAPPGCISPLVLSSYYGQFQDEDFVRDHFFEDEATERIFEQNCGPVQVMLRIDHEGHDLIIAFTTDGRLSYITDNQFCMCIDMST